MSSDSPVFRSVAMDDHQPNFADWRCRSARRSCTRISGQGSWFNGEPSGNENANKVDIAYLWDRVKKNANQPQKFGTQLTYSEKGQAVPFPIEDSKNANIWREAIGLAPIELLRAIGLKRPAANIAVGRFVFCRQVAGN